MKFQNPKDFFENSESLNDKDVQRLIGYTRELEGEIQDREIQDKYTKEILLKEFLNEVLNSINDIQRQDMEYERWNLGEKVDFRECILNLKKSIINFKEDNKI